MAKLVDIGVLRYSMPDDMTDDDIRKFAEKTLPKTQSWSNNEASTFGRQLQTEVLKSKKVLLKQVMSLSSKPAQRVMESLQNPIEAIKGTFLNRKARLLRTNRRVNVRRRKNFSKKKPNRPASLLQQIVQRWLGLAQNIPDAMMGGVLARGRHSRQTNCRSARYCRKSCYRNMSVRRERCWWFADKRGRQ